MRTIRGIQGKMWTYLVTVTAIDLVLDASVAGAMALAEMPNPLFWGAMAALLNFVPACQPARAS